MTAASAGRERLRSIAQHFGTREAAFREGIRFAERAHCISNTGRTNGRGTI